jgi:uncharacterized protein YegP (UPF0339 family)
LFDVIDTNIRLLTSTSMYMPEIQKPMTGYFEVYQDTANKFRFRLRASNGEIIATGEGYGSKESCMEGIASIKKNAHLAKVRDLTLKK